MATTRNLPDKTKQNYDIVVKILRYECLDDLQLTRSFKSRMIMKSQNYSLKGRSLFLKKNRGKLVPKCERDIKDIISNIYSLKKCSKRDLIKQLNMKIDNIGNISLNRLTEDFMKENKIIGQTSESGEDITSLLLNFKTQSPRPMYQVIFLIKKCPASHCNKKYIFSILDAFSGYQMVSTLFSKNPVEVLKIANEKFLVYGFPKIVLTNKEGAYRNQFFILPEGSQDKTLSFKILTPRLQT